MQEKIKQYYQERLSRSQQSIVFVKKQIHYLGTARLLVVLGAMCFAYFFRSQGTIIIVGSISAGLVIFLFLLLKYNQRQKKKDYLETSIACDENELKAFNYDFSAFDGALEKVDPSHPFSFDLDIFGNHSLFQSLNRTCTTYGKQVLTGSFENLLSESREIKIRQEAIHELSKKTDFIHHFRVTGITRSENNMEMKEIENFITQPPYIRSKNTWKFLRILIIVLWLAVISLSSIGWLSPSFAVAFYIITLCISESKAVKINHLQQWIGKKVTILSSYSQLIEAVEQETVESQLLKNLKSRFEIEGKSASTIIRQLARLSGELEQRSNLMIHLFLNPLFLWDIYKTIQIERWKENYGNQLSVWIRTLGEYDAFCSLGIFAFNHPEYIYPELTDQYFEMEGKQLGHPLMNRETCVRNDISMVKNPYFLIITGANMAGKSTYLRTVGVNFMLACIGAPVWADSLRLCPAALVTSLRTSDSLNDNESYFFAELKRLKMIINKLKAGEKLFIILDEILKGTNSVDKQRGSLALIQQFIQLQSCGIIATHDLLLGSLRKEFPENISNYRFEADINNDELTFSYLLRDGIAQNMNATFLMKKMGITV